LGIFKEKNINILFLATCCSEIDCCWKWIKSFQDSEKSRTEGVKYRKPGLGFSLEKKIIIFPTT
jgi:hypothetical protein